MGWDVVACRSPEIMLIISVSQLVSKSALRMACTPDATLVDTERGYHKKGIVYDWEREGGELPGGLSEGLVAGET